MTVLTLVVRPLFFYHSPTKEQMQYIQELQQQDARDLQLQMEAQAKTLLQELKDLSLIHI
eukprot:11642125-Prorocentrum_lima.AAC.1